MDSGTPVRGLPFLPNEPVIDGAIVLILDVKLDKEDVPRPELDLDDFVLSSEVVRLMSKLDKVRNGTILHLEVRAGLPRRLVTESRLATSLTRHVAHSEEP